MWVKICGNTNLEDAALAVELGADAVGFVFAASKRQVTAAQVGAITSQLPSNAERVGVFASHDADEIVRATSEAGLTTVQLHGGLDPHLLELLAKKLESGTSIIQTLHWRIDEPDAQQTHKAHGQSASALQLSDEIDRVAALGIAVRILIDSKVGAAGGGTGVTFDWGAARSILASAPTDIRFILAGGLRLANVSQAIHILEPWGVDVSSGVEVLPGKKDPALLARFIENARTHTPCRPSESPLVNDR